MSFDPLKKRADMAGLISEVTGTPLAEVNRRLDAERAEAGANVKAGFAEKVRTDGCERHVYNDAMERFYGGTDAFLYELAVWNLNEIKTSMGKWSCDWITKNLGRSKVLSIGDGLGFECLRFADAGHDVTYFEVPGYTASFAEKLFARRQSPVTHLTDPLKIPRGGFDAMICLDVLEHVPDPPGFVRTLLANLRPGGVFVVHAPFYLIQKNYPTHIRSSRRHSGDLSLYTDAGFKFLDGRFMWNPIVLQAPGGRAITPSAYGKLRMLITKPYLMMGRSRSKPFVPLLSIKRSKQQWFSE